MRIFRLIIILTSIYAVIGCSNKSDIYPGFSVNENGIHYKLVFLGDGAIKALPSDYITVNISYRTNRDSLFFQGLRKFQLTIPHFKGSIDECFAMLSEGDSATFYIDAESFFTKTLETALPRFIKPTERMRIDIKMIEIQTINDYQKEKEAFLHWIDDFGEYEKVILKQYFQGEKISVTPTKSGLYFIPVIKTNKSNVQVGDTVTVHYEGHFLNGKFFDSTKKRDEPFQFVYGQKWQVIEGLEEAIGLMREGEKAIVIIPSNLAFGNEGSSTGIIPPFTSVIFEVELLEVRKNSTIIQ